MESIHPAGTQPPWNDSAQGKIYIHTLVPKMSSKPDCNSDLQRNLTLDILHQQYPHEAWTRIYTDGSAIEDTRNGGASYRIFPV